MTLYRCLVAYRGNHRTFIFHKQEEIRTGMTQKALIFKNISKDSKLKININSMRMSLKPISIALFIVTAVSIYLLSSSNTPKFDFYRFSFEFLGAICRVKDCKSADLGTINNFGINMHGFWPQISPGSIDFCLYNAYDESKMNLSVLEEINANWNGAYNPSVSFRSHEWGKHGTCWAQQYYKNSSIFLKDDNYYELMNQYFALALHIKKSANLEELFFGDEGSERYEFKLSSLNRLMETRFGVKNIDLVCETIDGEQYLTEARFCLDLDYNYTDCPNPIVTCKAGMVVVQAYYK